VTDPDETTPLTAEEYAWVMHRAKRGGAEDPTEADRYLALRRRLRESIPDHEHQERTAYHEAAHAVVTKALGLTVPYVLIRDDDSGEAGWATPLLGAPLTADEALQDLLKLATLSAAGYVAEQMKWQYARTPEHGLTAQVCMKLRELSRIEQPMPEGVRAALSFTAGLPIIYAGATVVEHHEEPAQAILRANWNTVERLAAELIAHRRIADPELGAILADVEVISGI
jgi:hypothetical protein